MADAQITCVSKTSKHHEAIYGAGGVNWWWTLDQIIDSIERRSNTFYTFAAGKRADVLVVKGPTKKHIRSHADGIPNDNLLELPACPGH